jgi:hypothetical protein
MRRRYLQKMLRAMQESRVERTQAEQMCEVATGYYEGRLVQRVFCRMKSGLQEIKNKNRYSRLMNVLVAWKCFVKEKKLLNKYLTECNFQQSASQKYRS